MRVLACVGVAAAAFAMAGCGGGNGGGGGNVELKGSGASFPAPLYQRWFAEFSKANSDIKIEYASVGSGTGVTQFTQELVDFGASDAAMKDDEMAQVERGVQLLPMTAGSIVFCYNLNDTDGKPVEELKLSRNAYTGIMLGKVTKWNDPVIADANPGVKLSDQPISVVTRSDSSGTTYVCTQHLSAVNQEWSDGPGTGKEIQWPAGSGAPKNDGVAGAVRGNPGSIGYVEYGFAAQTGIAMATLENKSGNYVKPTPESAQKALGAIQDIPEDFRIWLPDPEGADVYPIVTYTWIMCYKKYDDAKKLEALKKAMKYCLTDGQKISSEMGYIPLPATIVDKALAALDNMEAAAPKAAE